MTERTKKERGRPRYYPFPDMVIGDSFVEPFRNEPENVVYIRVRTSVLRWARKHHRTFSADKTPEGILVKRLT